MYEPQELKAIMEETDKKYGNFPDTKLEENKVKRIRRLANFTPITHKVIETLRSYGLPYTLCEVLHSNKQKQRVTTDIFIPNANIVMRQVDINDEIEVSKAQSFYRFLGRNFHPFFIRSNEKEDFVLMKLNNCLSKANKEVRNGFKGVKQVKPKRPRIQGKRIQKVIR